MEITTMENIKIIKALNAFKNHDGFEHSKLLSKMTRNQIDRLLKLEAELLTEA
jgi:hypothetical protein